MPRYFVEFVNLQGKAENGNTGAEQPKSITVTLKLFSSSLPKTTRAVASLLLPEISDDKKAVTYKKSQVTRVIAPEYLVQFGRPVRRSKESLEKISPLIDIEEYRQHEAKLTERTRGRRGLVCVAIRPGEDCPDQYQSVELCIVFVPWGEYQELDGYVVVGECKEWAALSRWMSSVDVRQEPTTGSWEVPTGKGVWVNRCGRLQEKGTRETSKREKDAWVKKARAVDVLFKKQRVG